MTEEEGCFPGADASKISVKAIERGFNQIGTLGSGNHYLEIQVARPADIFDDETGPGFRHHDAQPDRHHVPLRQPGFWPPGGNRLPADLFECDGTQVRHQDRGSRTCLRTLSFARRDRTISAR